MQLTVLCKVVDNFGDIGVAWRLCRQLSVYNPECVINLIVDNLDSFSKINNSVESNKSYQEINNIHIYNWNDSAFCHEDFIKNDGEKLEIILELFQCGRPDWMEKILFEEKLNRTVHIIMVDYLTAEKYAEDFHCLQSLTRSSKVQKINFMPGFTNKTGGLIIDESWKNSFKRDSSGPILIFTYDKNWRSVLKAINHYQEDLLKNNKTDFDYARILAAPGKGFTSVIKSASYDYEINSKLFIMPLSFMNQTQWDEVMKMCSVLFIRGEESLTRACLSGIPFVWHAYPQSDEYQKVKVNALLDRMSSYFEDKDFEIVKTLWLYINSPEDEYSDIELENAAYNFLCAQDKLECGFKSFSEDLRKNGDLACNLMTFISKNYIIN